MIVLGNPITLSASSTDAAMVNHRIEHGPEHFRPLLKAVRDARVTMLLVLQGCGSFPLPTNGSAIFVIGDDLVTAYGPAGFNRCALERALASCAYISIVATAPVIAPYQRAADAAALLRANAAVIETRETREADWLDFVQAVNPRASIALATAKPEGGTH